MIGQYERAKELSWYVKGGTTWATVSFSTRALIYGSCYLARHHLQPQPSNHFNFSYSNKHFFQHTTLHRAGWSSGSGNDYGFVFGWCSVRTSAWTPAIMWGFCSFSVKYRHNFEPATTVSFFFRSFLVHHSTIIQSFNIIYEGEAVNRSQMEVKQQLKNDCAGEDQQKFTGPYWTGVVCWVIWELQLWELRSW
jgi:hypothetical protein